MLGIKNNGDVVGIESEKIDQIQKEFVTVINNANKLVPPTYLTVERVVINGAAILYIYVPPSSQVHRVNNRIFDRNYPIISAFFREIGRAEELGSGVRNLFHYTKAYSGGVEPQSIEEDIFKVVVPLDERLMLDNEQATPQDNENYSLMILDYCKIPRTRGEIQLFVAIADRKCFRESILKPLLESGKILQTIPDKPTSPKQKYYTNLNN